MSKGIQVQMQLGSKAKVLPLLLIEGYLGPEEDLDYAPFVDAIAKLKESGHKKAKLRINCGGGSITSGLAMYDAAIESGIDFETHIIGIAASMGGIIAQIAKPGKRKMSANAFFMTHRASARIEGDAETIASMAETLRKMEERAANIFSNRTGKPVEEVMLLMKSGVDKWMNAEEAKTYGLVDEIVDPENPLVVPEMKGEKDLATMVMMYQTKPNIMLKPDLLAKLGLKDNASAAEIEAAVETILNSNATMKAEIKSKEDQDAENVVNQAVTDGLIDEKDKPSMLAQAKANLEGTKTLLMMVKKQRPAAPAEMRSLINPEQKTVDQERKDWSLTDWQKKDAAGLIKMKSEKPDQYNELVKKSGVKIAGE